MTQAQAQPREAASEAASAGVADPGGPTGQLAVWLAGLTYADIPEQVRERAKHLVLDGVGCGLVAAKLPWSRTAVEAVTSFEGKGDSIVIGWDRKLSTPAAALLNSTFVQGFELDDFHPIAPVHSASLVLPAILGAAQEEPGVTGERAVAAAVAGFEVGPRVGLALHGADMLTRGWHSGPVFGTFSVAAASGLCYGLSAAQFEDALGLAGTQSGGLMAAQYGASSKRMQHGFAVRNGLYAAGLARHGYTGIKRVFEEPYGGFLSVFGEGHDPDQSQITAGLGAGWQTEFIMVKSYAAMGGLQGAVDAVKQLQAQGPVDPDQIDRIVIDLGETVYHHGWWPPQRPLTPTGAQMNVGYVTAVALLDGTALPEQFSAERRDADDVWRLIEKTEVNLDEAFDKGGIATRFSTRLTVTLIDGSTRTALVAAPKGSPLSPLTNDEIAAKYDALTARVVDKPRADRIKQIVRELDQAPGLGELVELLAPQVKGVWE